MMHDDGLRLVLVEGAPALRAPAAEANPDFIETIEAMRAVEATCKAAGGLGLAATQIGIPLRVVVADGVTLVNPTIVERSTTTWLAPEACLSQPGVQVTVRRATRIVVRDELLTDEDEGGDYVFQGMRARVVQHEIDHLDGALITDKGPRLGPVAWGSPYRAVAPERHGIEREVVVFCPGCGHAYPWYSRSWRAIQARCFSPVCATRTKGDGTLINVKGWRPWR